MTASPTHLRTGEPETEAGRDFVAWLYSGKMFLPAKINADVLAIEAEAAKRERDRIATTIDALRARTADDIGMRGAQWLWSDDILAAISEGSPDPVPDEPPGVATEAWGK